MGQTASLALRIGSGIATGGMSEVFRAASKPIGKATGINPKIVETAGNLGRNAVNVPSGGSAAASAPLAVAGLLGGGDKAAPVDATVTKLGMTDAEREREARIQAANRKKQYENLGRSSTILTGPGGLGGSGVGQQKSLLGY